jgi:hypothetical protein
MGEPSSLSDLGLSYCGKAAFGYIRQAETVVFTAHTV